MPQPLPFACPFSCMHFKLQSWTMLVIVTTMDVVYNRSGQTECLKLWRVNHCCQEEGFTVESCTLTTFAECHLDLAHMWTVTGRENATI